MTSTNATTRRSIEQSDRLIGAAVGLAALVVYVITLCPTIFADDCGEITTAVATGGVMHPPGYPLYSLIGRLFVTLIPHGEPAWRLGLLSAIPAALAVSITYFACRRMAVGRLWSACSALSLAFSYTLWQQATKVETYSLNAFFVALLLLLAGRYRQSGLRRDFLLTAFVGGLALTNHLTILWLIPAVLCIITPTLLRVEKARGALAVLLAAAVCCAAPLSLYGYEMIAARTHPGGQVWGDPSTLHRLFLQVSGARYHNYFHWPTLRIFMDRDIHFAPMWLWRCLFLVLPLSVVGVWRLLEKPSSRTLGIGLILAVAGYLICNTLYGILNIFEYYTGAVVALTMLGACGGQQISDWLKPRLEVGASHRAGAILAGSAAMVVFAFPLVHNWPACDRHGADYLRTLAQNTMRTLPPNAVVIARGDNRLFPLWYVQTVLGERPDVVIVPAGLLDNWSSSRTRELTGWSAALIDRTHPEMHVRAILAAYSEGHGDRGKFGATNMLMRQALAKGRPLYYTSLVPGDLNKSATGASQLVILPGYTLVPTGVCEQILPLNSVPKPAEGLARQLALEKVIHFEYAPPELFAEEPDGAITNKVYAYSLTTTALLFAGVGDMSDSLKRAETAYQLDDTQAQTADAYAYACLRNGRPEDAINAWKHAVALEPDNPDYRHNLDLALKQTALANGSGG